MLSLELCFIDVPPMFSCPADHVPDWQPRLFCRYFQYAHSIPIVGVGKRGAGRSTPVAQLAPRNLLTRWDVSSIPANGIFLTKN